MTDLPSSNRSIALTNLEIALLVNQYIGVSGGYLGDFNYRTHAEFYKQYCDLDIDTFQYQGTTRQRFITILSGLSPLDQAKVVRGVLYRFPVGVEPRTRTEVLRNEFKQIIRRLESGDSMAGDDSFNTPSALAIPETRVLFLAANPIDTKRLAIDEEMRTIEQKVRASMHRDALLFQSAWALRPDDLLQLLNQHQPHVVHFSGHGSRLGLSLLDKNGQAKLVTTQALAALFHTLKGNIQLVFLNACYSREQAQAIVASIDCVIGMKESIHDQAATIFSSSFYRSLGFGHSIQKAFEEAKIALLLEGILDEDVPELLIKVGVDANKVVLIAP